MSLEHDLSKKFNDWAIQKVRLIRKSKNTYTIKEKEYN